METMSVFVLCCVHPRSIGRLLIAYSFRVTKWWHRIRNEPVPASAVAFPQGTDLHTIFFDFRQCRHTAVHRVLQSTEKVQSFVAGAIVIAEGLRDGPRAEKLHRIRDALSSRDTEAIFSIVSTPRQYFQLSQVNNPLQLPRPPSSNCAHNRSMSHCQQQSSLVNPSDASALIMHDESILDCHDPRGRSQNRGDLLIPRARGRSDSPHRRAPTIIRDRDNHFFSRRSIDSLPNAPTNDLANTPFTLAGLGDSDDEEYIPDDSGSNSGSLDEYSDTELTESSEDDEIMEDSSEGLSEDEYDEIPRGRGARLETAFNLSDIKQDNGTEVEGIEGGDDAYLQSTINGRKRDDVKDEDDHQQGVPRGCSVQLQTAIDIIDLTRDDEHDNAAVPTEVAVHTKGRGILIDLTLDE